MDGLSSFFVSNLSSCSHRHFLPFIVEKKWLSQNQSDNSWTHGKFLTVVGHSASSCPLFQCVLFDCFCDRCHFLCWFAIKFPRVGMAACSTKPKETTAVTDIRQTSPLLSGTVGNDRATIHGFVYSWISLQLEPQENPDISVFALRKSCSWMIDNIVYSHRSSSPICRRRSAKTWTKQTKFCLVQLKLQIHRH